MLLPVEQAALRRCILHDINHGNCTDNICIIQRATMRLSGKFSKMRICTRRMLFVHAASHCGCVNVVRAKQTTMAMTHHFLDLALSYLRPFIMLKMDRFLMDAKATCVDENDICLMEVTECVVPEVKQYVKQ